MSRRAKTSVAVLSLTAGFTGLVACGPGSVSPAEPQGAHAEAGTAEEAQAFVAEANTALRELLIRAETAGWNYATNMTAENEAQQVAASEATMAYYAEAIPQARAFDGVNVDGETRRQLDRIIRGSSLPAPNDASKRAELAQISAKLESLYSKGKYCPSGPGSCRDLGQLSDVMFEARDYDKMLEAWSGWRTVSVPMAPLYQRFVELGNEGAREIGYDDVGQLWREKYEMDSEAFRGEVDRLWSQVQPLYSALHCEVRAKLQEAHGKEKVPDGKPIPAHLLGNMWAQEWLNVYPLVEPYKGQPSINVTQSLKDKGYDPIKMVKQAETFFVSLGLDALPSTFWERSMFDKPTDRDVVCHPSAWNPSMEDDQRIKMCIKINQEDFITIHHELGHNYYYHYYRDLPALYQSGAHAGFHEGIGDTLALSVTPKYLHEIGLLDSASDDPKAVINNQMQMGLDKVAFLPFGLLLDRWRWDVFAGKITPDNYNEAWWELRESLQGVASPVERPSDAFDPGAKFHIPGNTSYTRYFLARILQFQFHKALCEASGHEGPLHTCSIYGSKKAGDKLKSMLELGGSKPWSEALESITGSKQMDASAMIEYFEPLAGYLKERNKGRQCGW